MLIIRSNSINTASGIVFCVSDRRLGRLKGCSFSTCTPNGHLQRVLHLHTGRSLNREYYTCTPNGHLQRILHLHTGWSLNREYYTWTPNGHLQRILHLHTERSLTENTTPAHRLNWEYMYIYIYIFTAIGLLPGGSGYFTYKQNMKLVTTRFKTGELHEKTVVATWNLGNHLSICF